VRGAVEWMGAATSDESSVSGRQAFVIALYQFDLSFNFLMFNCSLYARSNFSGTLGI